MEPTVGTVFLAALVTASATGLGALPLLVVRSAGRLVLGASNAVAAGVMLAASVSLSVEGVDRSPSRAALGVALGICFVLGTQRYLEHDHGHAMGSLRGEDARRALLIVGVMTVHSAAEGIGVGAAFADGSTLGLVITVAIAVHNIPEGLAISLVMVPRGTSVRRQQVEHLLEPAAAASRGPRVSVRRHVRVDPPDRIGVRCRRNGVDGARGLLPEALDTASARIVALAGGTAFALMLGFQLLLS